MDCPRCGHRLEASAEPAEPTRACPHCGAPVPTPSSLETLAASPDPTPEQNPPTAVAARSDETRVPPAGSAPPPPLAVVHAEGTPFGRYRLLSSLGEGGMGLVWKAWDTELARVVALKQIKGLGSEETVTRFLREARVAAKLRHPGIVGVYDVGQAEGQHYITMEYVEGRTFISYLAETRETKRKREPVDPGRLRAEVRILADVAAAVAHAHREGVVHRDLKPGNVLLDRGERPCVMDFGLAKEIQASTPTDTGVATPNTLTQSGQVLGTPAYMSPEQVDADTARIGPASDVWALGVMLYELLAGCLPFDEEKPIQTMYAVLQRDPPPPRALNPHAPWELEAVCLRAMEKDPARRYADAADFGAELERWLRGEAVLAKSPSTVSRIWRRMVRRRAVLVPVAAALVVALSALGWAWQERARGVSRTRRMLEPIAPLVARFEDAVMKREMPPETRVLIAEQPLAMLDRLIQDDPTFGPAYAWRGNVYVLLGREAEAEADFDRACALSPETAAVWFWRGMHRIDRYARARGLPQIKLEMSRVTFVTVPETAEEARWRQSGLADLERLDRALPNDESCEAEDVSLAHAVVALHEGGAASLEQALALVSTIERPKGWRVRGLASYLLSRFDDAEKAFARTLAEWPLDIATLVQRGCALQALGKQRLGTGGDAAGSFAESQRSFEEAMRRSPDCLVAVFDRASVLLDLADARERHGEDPRPLIRASIAGWDELVRLRPEFAGIRGNRGSAWWILGQAEDARGANGAECFGRSLADLDAALKMEPANAETVLNRGLVHYSLGQKDQAAGRDPRARFRLALADLDESIRLHPTFASAFDDRASVRTSLGAAEALRGGDPLPAYREAVRDGDEALRLFPQFAEARMTKGLAFERMAEARLARGEDPADDLRAATAEYDAALQINPELASAYCNRGNARHRLAERDAARGEDPRAGLWAAIADQGEALRRNPNLAEAYSNGGNERQALGEEEQKHGEDPRASYQAALADLDAALRINPDFGEAYNNRGIVWRTLGDAEENHDVDPRPSYRKGLADYEESLRRNPEDAGTYNNRGALLLNHATAEAEREGDAAALFARAEDDLRRATGKGYAPAWRNLALLYRRIGRYEEALAAYETAARVDVPEAAASRADIAQTEAGMRAHIWPWMAEAAHGQKCFESGDYPQAKRQLDLALALVAEWLRPLAEEERALRLADAKLRATLADVHLRLACIESLRSDGRDRPKAVATAVAEEERTRRRDRAIGHLQEAVRLGYREDFEPLDEMADLAPLRADPRFAAIVKGLR